MSKSDWASRPLFCVCQLLVWGATNVVLLVGLSRGIAMAAFPGGFRPGAMPFFGGHGGAFVPRSSAPVYRPAPRQPPHAKYVPPKRPPQKAVPQEHKPQQHVPQKQAPQHMRDRRAMPPKVPAATKGQQESSERRKPQHIQRSPIPGNHVPKDMIRQRLDHQRLVPPRRQIGNLSKESPRYQHDPNQHGPSSKSIGLAAERHRPYDDWRHSRWDRDYWWYNHHFHDHYAYWEHYSLWHDRDWWYWDDYDYDEAWREATIAAIESQVAYAEDVLGEAVSSQEQAQDKLDEYHQRITAARTAIENASAEQADNNKSMHGIEAQVISAQGPDSALSKAQAKVDELRQSLDGEVHRVLSLPPHAGKPTWADYVRELAILLPDQKEQLANDAKFRAVEEDVKAATREVLRERRALFEANADWVAARDAAFQAQRENAEADRELGKYTGPIQLAPKRQLRTAAGLASQAREIIAAGKAALRSLGARVPDAGSSANSS